MESHQHLFEVVSGELLLEASTVGNVVEEFSSKDWLHGNVANTLAASIALDLLTFHVTIEVSDDVLVLKVLAIVEFVLNEINGFLFNITSTEIKDFEGDSLVSLGVCS